MLGSLGTIFGAAGKAIQHAVFALIIYAVFEFFDVVPGPFDPLRELSSIVGLLLLSVHDVLRGAGWHGVHLFPPAGYGQSGTLDQFFSSPIVYGLRMIEIWLLMIAAGFMVLALSPVWMMLTAAGRRRRALRAISRQTVFGAATDATEAQALTALRGKPLFAFLSRRSADDREF
jgi:hypothetical protein